MRAGEARWLLLAVALGLLGAACGEASDERATYLHVRLCDFALEPGDTVELSVSSATLGTDTAKYTVSDPERLDLLATLPGRLGGPVDVRVQTPVGQANDTVVLRAGELNELVVCADAQRDSGADAGGDGPPLTLAEGRLPPHRPRPGDPRLRHGDPRLSRRRAPRGVPRPSVSRDP